MINSRKSTQLFSKFIFSFYIKPLLIKTITILAFFSVTVFAKEQPIILTNAGFMISFGFEPQIRETAVRILNEELEKRSGNTWNLVENWNNDNDAIIAIVLYSETKLFGEKLPPGFGEELSGKAEAFRLFTSTHNGKDIVWLAASDSRGLIFGIGHLLRTLNISEGEIFLPGNIDITVSPDHPIRGHQLGYRNTANSYDAWSVQQYDQYIRELALFGTNCIENIPFGKNNDSPHMQISREEMNIELGKICEAYDMDYWVWTPATFDLKDAAKRSAALREHEEFYKVCPRLDNIFFPGGDPGHNHPSDVMPFLHDLNQRLVKYHPEAGIWISLQGFSEEQIDYFYTYLKENSPDWLRGVVSGPSSPPIAETRFRLPEKYKHRQYPDITHTVRCEFPAKNWDQAYALTLGREPSNPQPFYYAKLHEKYAPFTDGFISYSDGAHDDVNKIVWSMKSYNSSLSVNQILEDYTRFFFGPEVSKAAADGILALEQNWIGPLAENGGVEATLSLWQGLEKQYPELSSNWRWQLLLMRANYDAYTRRRLIYEAGFEKEAYKILGRAESIGIDKAMKLTLDLVNKAEKQPIDQELRKKVENLCEDLFTSVGLQTHSKRHKASGAQRGCVLDFLDYPLNNRWWLEDEFAKINEMETEEEKLARLKIIRNWESPGPGSYYDNISNIAQSPRVKTTSYDATDFAWWNGGWSRARLSSQVFQTSPELEYEDLDPNARYIIRIAGYGDALLRVDGKRLEPYLYNKDAEGLKEFVVPKSVVGDGELKVTFDLPEESHLNWRKYSRISDVWLIKR